MDQILSANTSRVAAAIISDSDTDDICVTLLLDVNAVSCNCSNFPATDKVLLPTVIKLLREEIFHIHREMMILLMPQTLIIQTRIIGSQMNHFVPRA